MLDRLLGFIMEAQLRDMGYFQAKKDLEFMEQFKSDVNYYWNLEREIQEGTTNLGFNPATNEVARQALIKKYQPLEQELFEHRERISKTVRRASRIANKNGAAIFATSFPAPAIGGPIFNINLFDAILTDYGYRNIGNNEIWDAIKQSAVMKNVLRLNCGISRIRSTG
jgi:hypothetical protein